MSKLLLIIRRGSRLRHDSLLQKRSLVRARGPLGKFWYAAQR
jgi:hypothetical protein